MVIFVALLLSRRCAQASATAGSGRPWLTSVFCEAAGRTRPRDYRDAAIEKADTPTTMVSCMVRVSFCIRLGTEGALLPERAPPVKRRMIDLSGQDRSSACVTRCEILAA
jgi:hypothetical protein